MSDNEIADRIRRATAAHVKTSWQERLNEWVDAQGKVALFFVALRLATLLAVTLFEAHNAAKGWSMITAGAAPGFLAYGLGVAMTLGALSFFRRTAEHVRAKKNTKAAQSAMVAVICTALSLFGVFSNVSSKTDMGAKQATESNVDRAYLLAEARALESDLSASLSREQLDAMVDATTRRIKSQEALAVGWDMGSASTEECARDLQTPQRNICNTLNGDANRQGLRNEVLMYRAALSDFDTKTEKLALLRGRLDGMQNVEGAAHWAAMAKISQGSVDADSFRIYGSFFASFGILLILMFGWDAFFEAREDEDEDEANG